MNDNKLKVALILGEYQRPDFDGVYYLVEGISIGKENENGTKFTELFTNKEYVNTIVASEFGLDISYTNPLPIERFFVEKECVRKDGTKYTKTIKKFDKDKCIEYYKFMEKMVFVQTDEIPLLGINVDEFEKEFKVDLGLNYVEDENVLVNALLNGDLTEEEFFDKIEEKYDLKPQVTRGEDIESKLQKTLDKPISEIVNKLKSSIINQDEAIKKIVLAIYKYALFGKDMKSNILLYGPSGVGKTALINEVAKVIDYPVHIEDMSNYSATGYKGANVEDILIHLYNNAGGDINKAEHSILFLDEIDKKAGKDADISVSKSDVLKGLLKIVEGGVFTLEINHMGDTIKFDTSKLLIIAGGAFTDLYDKQAMEKKNNIGFGTDVKSKEEVKYGSELTIKDFEKFGMPLEFMGRFKTIIRMNSLNLDNLITILKSSNLSELKKYVNALQSKGVTLNIPDAIYEKIALAALSYGTGARGLNLVVDKIFENVFYEIFNDGKNIEEVTLGDNIVENQSDFILKKRL